MKWCFAAIVVVIALLDVPAGGCFGGRSRPPRPPVEPIADPAADEAAPTVSADSDDGAAPAEKPAAADG